MNACAVFPVEIAVQAKTSGGAGRLQSALEHLTGADPTLSMRLDPESGLTFLAGQDDLQLDRVLEQLVERDGLDIRIGTPMVVYRECLFAPAHSDFTYRRVVGANREFARVGLNFRPGKRNSGVRFLYPGVDVGVPAEYYAGIEAGIETARQQGLIAGFPVIDFEVVLAGGAYHDADSSIHAFKLAAMGAFRSLRDRADVRICEPVMRLEVTVPKRLEDKVMGWLAGLEASSIDRRPGPDDVMIAAAAPMSRLFGARGSLNGLLGADTQFTLAFSHYEEIPQSKSPDPAFPPAAALRA